MLNTPHTDRHRIPLVPHMYLFVCVLCSYTYPQMVRMSNMDIYTFMLNNGLRRGTEFETALWLYMPSTVYMRLECATNGVPFCPSCSAYICNLSGNVDGYSFSREQPTWDVKVNIHMGLTRDARAFEPTISDPHHRQSTGNLTTQSWFFINGSLSKEETAYFNNNKKQKLNCIYSFHQYRLGI